MKNLIENIKREQKEKLLKFGYSEEQTEFLNDIADVKFFAGKPSKAILKNGMELYL